MLQATGDAIGRGAEAEAITEAIVFQVTSLQA